MELMTINVQDGRTPIQVCVNESNYGDELSRLRNYLKLAEAAFDAQEKFEEFCLDCQQPMDGEDYYACPYCGDIKTGDNAREGASCCKENHVELITLNPKE